MKMKGTQLIDKLIFGRSMERSYFKCERRIMAPGVDFRNVERK